MGWLIPVQMIAHQCTKQQIIMVQVHHGESIVDYQMFEVLVLHDWGSKWFHLFWSKTIPILLSRSGERQSHFESILMTP